MTDPPAAAPESPGRPRLSTLLWSLVFAQIVLGGLIFAGLLFGMISGLFPHWAKNGDTHGLLGWPYLADGVWSVVADGVIIAALAAIGSLIVIHELRIRGFRPRPGVTFVALLAAPTGLPAFLHAHSLPGFLIALVLLAVAARPWEPRLFIRRYWKAAAAVGALALALSLSYGLLHPFGTNMSSGAQSTTRPDAEEWQLPRRGLAIETLYINNPGFFDATLTGVEAPTAQRRLKDVLVGHWEPWFGPKDAVWPEGRPSDFTRSPLHRLALPAHSTRAVTVVFRPKHCRHLGDLAPVRYVRLRYRLGSLTLSQPFQFPEPLALCDKSRAT
ncbi:MAG: hypothetical protein WBQ14_00250 [Gaiellaceae bacterium]